MAKQKKKNDASALLSILTLGSPQVSESTIEYADKEESAPKKKKASILERRFQERDIPKVDDGVRDGDLSYDALQKFYHNARVGEFLKPSGGGKYIKFEFGPMLNGYRTNTDDNDENDIIRKLTYAELSKKSFINNINLSLRYINYFIEYFDDDDELLNAYFNMMFQIHYTKLDMSVENFVDSLFAFMATESMVDKVIRMVEYNTDTSLIKKTDRTYDESIQLTVEHLKAIMGVSCFHKFVIPIVSHYYTLRKKELEKEGVSDRDLYYQVFSSFIPLFDKHYDIKLYGKLYHTATTRISKTENQENTMWKRRNRFGTTVTSFANELICDYLCEISQKVVFNRSAIIFIHVCFDKAIKNELIQSDKYEMSDMKMEASDSVNETISRWDRWQMDKTMHSEKDRLRAHVSIIDSINRLGYEVGINFPQMESKDPKDIKATKELREEYEYYMENVKRPFNDTQVYLMHLYYSGKTHSSEEGKQMEIPMMIKLIMIMKRDLASRNFNYLPYFISSEVMVSAARKCNRKRVENCLETHPSYSDWKEEYGDMMDALNKERLLNELKMIMSCPVRVIDYEQVELRGRKMTPTECCVVDEWLRFMLDL